MHEDTIQDRIFSRIEKGELAEIARKCEIGESTLRSYRKSMPGADVLAKLAKGLNVNIRWLATGEGPASPYDSNDLPTVTWSAGTLPASVAQDFALIPRLDVRASAGHGALSVDEEVIDFLAFQASWLRGRNINPAAARVMTARGDSMETTIRDGDVLLVDTSVDRFRDNSLYVLVFGDLVFVKRIHQRLTGAVSLISDNDRYPPEEVPAGEVQNLHVAGRVVWFGRSI